MFTWIDEEKYSKIFKDGYSKMKFIKNGMSFSVFTKRKNNYRIFIINFYDSQNRRVLCSEARYLILSEEDILNLLKDHFKIKFYRKKLKEPYQKLTVLSLRE